MKGRTTVLIVGLLLPVLFGLAISWLIISGISFSERLGLAYALGFGFLTLVMFFLNVLGTKFSLINTILVVSAITGLLLLLLRRINGRGGLLRTKMSPILRLRETLCSLSVFEKILVGLIVFFILSNLVIAVYWPVWWSDSLTCYDLRAKFFGEAQSFGGAMALLKDRALRESYSFYVFERPPMTSLTHTWLYLSGWSNPKVFYSLLLVSLSLIFYHSLRVYARRYHALLFTLILVTTPYVYIHATNSYTNFAFAFYFSVAAFYLYRYTSTGKWGFLCLAGLMLGLSSWVRQESSIFFLGYLAILLTFSIHRKRFFAPVVFALLYLSIASLWGTYVRFAFDFGSTDPLGAMSRVQGILDMGSSLLDFSRWRAVLVYFWNDVLAWVRVVFWVLILAVFLYADRIRKHLSYYHKRWILRFPWFCEASLSDVLTAHLVSGGLTNSGT